MRARRQAFWTQSLSQGLTQQFPQLRLEATAQAQLRAILQDHAVVAVVPGLKLLDALDVNDRGAMDTQESVRAEFYFEAVHGLAEQVRFWPNVSFGVVTCGPDPIDLLRLQEVNPAGELHHQPLHRLSLETLREGGELLGDITAVIGKRATM